MRRFQKIDVNEPTVEDAIEIMKGLKPYFESFHKVRYTNDAIKAAVELSSRYINDRKLPDKAIDVIDETGGLADAVARIAPSQDDQRQGDREHDRHNGAHSAKTVSANDEKMLVNLEAELKRVVYGQDTAIEALSLIDQAGTCRPARNRKKPIGSYLFSGPTGVGKTRGVAKQLAASLGVELLRFRHVGIHGASQRSRV